MGGHLSTLETEEKINEIIKLIKQNKYDHIKFYIGGSRTNENNEYRWVDVYGTDTGSSLNSSNHWIPRDPI